MKFTKFGKALLMSALSAGVVFSVTSCVQSYSVGYLYVTGMVTADPSGSGIISGFKIDHNTGKLTPINGMPVSSGGANPVRAVLISGSRFIYVLNRGTSSNPAGSDICTTEYPCANSNVTQFAVGANGILTAQETFYTKGLNPFRLIADGSGSHLFVLEHDSLYNGAPSSAANPNPNCTAALGDYNYLDSNKQPVPITTCGDITAFSINSATGRLTLVVDSQASTAQGVTLPYFPVPANPVDFVLAGTALLTMSGTPATASTTTYPYTGGSIVFPYTYSSSSSAAGLLAVVGGKYPYDSLDISAGTALAYAAGYVWALDNEAPSGANATGAASQMVPYTLGTNDALTATSFGPVVDDATQSNPIMLTVESKGTRFYVANQGNPKTPTLPLSGIAGYVVNSPPDPKELGGEPIGFGAGAGPQCLVEDPSDQFFYTANYDAMTVTGQVYDPVSGVLTPLNQSSKVPSSYTLTGKPTWCLVDGRTS